MTAPHNDTDTNPDTPDTHTDLDTVRTELQRLRSLDVPTHGGSTFAYVYDSGRPDVDGLGLEALAMFGESNGLDPTAFPSLLAMERDLVAMAGEFTRAPAGFVGTVTSGGTESILLAVQTARDARPDVSNPLMVIPSTAHAASPCASGPRSRTYRPASARSRTGRSRCCFRPPTATRSHPRSRSRSASSGRPASRTARRSRASTQSRPSPSRATSARRRPRWRPTTCSPS